MTELDFFDLYPSAEFRHREELEEGLDEGTWEFSSFTGGARNKVTGEVLLKAYGHKAEDPSCQPEQGFVDLLPQLESRANRIIEVWSFVGPDAYINVFIDQVDKTVLASVFTAA